MVEEERGQEQTLVTPTIDYRIQELDRSIFATDAVKTYEKTYGILE